MVFGFAKSPWSPARKGALRRQRAGARHAKRLTNLHLEEVSSVASGAGHGVDVVLRKRDERTTPMNINHPTSALSFCKSAMANEPTQEQVNELIRVIADTHFGGSVSKLFAFDRMGRPANVFCEVFTKAHTTSDDGPWDKSGKKPGNNQDNMDDSTDGALDDDNDDDADVDKLLLAVEKLGLKGEERLAALGKIAAIEKARKFPGY